MAAKTELNYSGVYGELAEKTLDTLLASAADDKLYEAMRYSALSGGKRIRAYLTCMFYKAITGDSGALPALPYAAAVEMIHAASLIHDDLPAMDNDDFRRGKPSNHKKFGEAQAILAGDGLFIKAFTVIASNGSCSDKQNAKAVKILSEKSGPDGMTGGQMIDIESVGREIDGALLKKLDLLKTSCLISAACMLGVIAANGSEEQIYAAEEYGRDLGLAFQIKDDILDIEGSSEAAGKTLGKDAKDNKPTYPALFGLDEAKRVCEAITEKAISSLDIFGKNQSVTEIGEFTLKLMQRNK